MKREVSRYKFGGKTYRWTSRSESRSKANSCGEQIWSFPILPVSSTHKRSQLSIWTIIENKKKYFKYKYCPYGYSKNGSNVLTHSMWSRLKSIIWIGFNQLTSVGCPSIRNGAQRNWYAFGQPGNCHKNASLPLSISFLNKTLISLTFNFVSIAAHIYCIHCGRQHRWAHRCRAHKFRLRAQLLQFHCLEIHKTILAIPKLNSMD